MVRACNHSHCSLLTDDHVAFAQQLPQPACCNGYQISLHFNLHLYTQHRTAQLGNVHQDSRAHTCIGQASSHSARFWRELCQLTLCRQSGFLVSSRRVQVSMAALVSCPASKMVLISKQSCSSTVAVMHSPRSCMRNVAFGQSGMLPGFS